MKRLTPSKRPNKEVVNRAGGNALICKHDENQKHIWFSDGRDFNPAPEPNLNVSPRPSSSVSSHPTTAMLRERLRGKRWADEIDTEIQKKSKFEAPGPPPPPPPVPPPRKPDKKSNDVVVEGVVDLPSYIPRPLDSGYSYVIATASFSGHVVVGGTIHSFSPFLNTFSNFYSVSIGRVSWISSAMIGSYYWTGIFATDLTNKYGYRTVCIGGSVIASAAYVSTVFANSTAYLVCLQGFVAGIGLGCIFTPSTMSIGNYFEEKRATASGISRAGAGFGTMVFPPVANWLINSLGWKGANLIIALVILIVGTILGVLFRPVEVPKMKKQYLHDRVAEVYRTSQEDENYQYQIPGKYFNSSTAQDATSSEKSLYKKFIEYFSKPKTDHSERILGNDDLMERFGANMPLHIFSGQNVKENIYGVMYDEKDEEALKKLKIVPTTEYKSDNEQMNSLFCCSTAPKGEKYITVPPLAREDVFYAGNLRSLKEFDRSNQSMPTYTWETNIINNAQKVLTSELFGKPLSSNSGSGSGKGYWKSFKEIMDPKLLGNPVILLLIFATFSGVLGAYIPFTFYRAVAMKKGIDSFWATFLISCMGVPNVVEGFLAGFVAAFFKEANSYALWINNISLLLAGLCMVLTPLADTLVDFVVIAVFYGIFIFIYFSLSTIILVELNALKNLTSGIKLLLFFKGIAGTIGNPIAGYIQVWTNSYDGSFYFCGSVLFLSALLHSLLPLASRYCLHQATLFKRKSNEEDETVIQKREMWQKGFEKFITPEVDKKKKNQKISQTEPSNKINKNIFPFDETNDLQIQDMEYAVDDDDRKGMLSDEPMEETRFNSPERNNVY